MTKDYTALEAELRLEGEFLGRQPELGEAFLRGTKIFKAADAIADLRRERDEARAETERQYEENVARIAEEGAAILRAEAADRLEALEAWKAEAMEVLRQIRLQDRVTRHRGTEQQFYEDGPCGKIARRLVEKEDGRGPAD